MKKKILELLRANQGVYLSGEKISQILGVTRTTVWKHIKKLKEEGYEITSISNKGYMLHDKKQLNQVELETLIEKEEFMDRAVFLETVGSTNDYVKAHFASDLSEVVIVSEEQTKGRGRLGNAWASKKQEGIFMSLLLRPDILPTEASKITLTAAAAMSLALESIIQKEVFIKWPNDLIIDGKKVCGILTEMSAELGHVNYIVLGIGINVSQEIFDEDLKNKATSLLLATGEKISRYDILEAFFKHFKILYGEFVHQNYRRIMSINRSKSVTLHKDVNLIEKGQKKVVYAMDITDEGELLVEDQGQQYTVSYGEVSVRGINGYI